MANKATTNPTQHECRLIKLSTSEGKRFAITAKSYEELVTEVSRELGVSDFDVVIEDDGSALSPTVVDHILEFGLDAGRLMVVPTPGCQSAQPAQPAPRPRQLVQPVPQLAADPVSLKPPSVLIDPPAGDHTPRRKLSSATSPTGSRPVTPDAPVVKVHDDCETAYVAVKKDRKHRYVLYGFTGDVSQIVVLKKANRNATYGNFTQDLYDAEKNKECRFAVFDVEYVELTGMPRNKIVFLMWCPDGALARQKMLYAASNEALRRALGEGIATEIQANDHGDLQWTNILQRIGAPTPKH